MAENLILTDLTYDPDNGALLYKGVRYLLIRPETLSSFQEASEARFGVDATGEVLYQGGFTGGRLSGLKYKQEFNLTDREAVEFMCKMGGQIGWGKFDLVELDSLQYRIIVEVTNSPFAEAVQRSRGGADITQGKKNGHATCHLIRGVLGGLGNGIFGVEVDAKETRCTSFGHTICRFEITGIQTKS